MIAATRNASGAYKGWDLRMQNGRIQLLAAAESGSSSSIITDRRYDDGQWHHIAIEWDPASGAKGQMKIYVDGTLAKAGSGAGDLGDGVSRRFTIGAQMNANGSGLFFWKGDLDEFRFSNGLLEPKSFIYGKRMLPLPPSQLAEGPIVQNISAAYRHGQVFIQWDEIITNTANLKVYMYTKPITTETFSQAQLVEQRIEPHSANDWYEDPEECPKTAGPARGWIIEDGGKPIDRTGGLFVYTVEESDPAQAFFVVLADNQTVADIKPGQNSLTSSVKMAVEPIRAIWQLGSAPNPSADGKPLAIYLHSHTSRPSGALTYLVFGDSTMGWRKGLPFKFKVTVRSDVVLVEPYDRVWINRRISSAETYEAYNTEYKNIETWHYGTSDKIYDPALRYKGVVVNYTERLDLWELDWVQQTYKTDPNRVYATGASMGTWAQQLAMWHPDRFASVDVLVPFVDWSYVNGSESNAKRLAAACGPMSMMTSDGITLGERANLVALMQKTTGDLPPAIIRIGRTDGSVYWARKPAYIKAMQTNRHELIAGWDNGNHSTAMRSSNIPGFPNFRDFNYASSHFALNKSYPAFTYFSMNQNPGNGDKTDGDITGFINRGLEWSGIVDQDDRYKVEVQVTLPDVVYPVSVDITPRNLQNFHPQPGQTVRAQNRNSDGAVVEEKTLTVDPAGRVSYEGFAVTSAKGNMLILE